MKQGLMMMVAGMATALAAHAGEPADLARAYAAEFLADAQSRTSELAQQRQTFTVAVNGQIQFRYIINNRSEPPAGEEDLSIGFQTRRTKIEVGGKVHEDWGYKIVGAFNRDGGGFVLEDAFGTYAVAEGWTLTFGQFKLPILREESLSSKNQLAADRSVMNNVFSQTRSQGITLGYEADDFRFVGAVSDGIRSTNTEFGSESADFGLTARAEYKISGNWRQFRDFTSFRNSDDACMIGGAFHYESGGDTQGSTDADLMMATIDGAYEGNGWNVYAAGVWRRIDPAGGTSLDDMGVLVQGGAFVGEQTELFARWDAVFPDSDRTGLDDFYTFTIGMNYYVIPESHAAKLTIDLQYLLSTPAEGLIPSSSGMRGIGLVANDLDDGQWALRGQFQILF